MVIDVRDNGDLMKDGQLGWTMTFERLRGQRSDNLVIVRIKIRKQSRMIFKFLAWAIIGSNH